ncbi:MAG: SusD/RagB family nutrient-binding outer membrane lipoprotein [Bacteroidaceae bacterium]|nr:SusD/RagB family nutrient-binding outer membrane lipoprotein [Bacteroidaceae bacterium]
MKKIFLLAFAVVGLVSFVSCSDSDYDDRYADPSKTSSVGVPQVFTGVLQAGNTWMNPVYYRYYTQSSTSGVFSGVIGNTNGRGRFRGASEGYFNSRWQSFYNQLTQYRVLEDTYNNLSDDEKAANKVFLLLGRTVIEAQLHEMLSIWGDVPYSGAGTLWKTSDYAAAKAAAVYDDDVEVYKQILTDLKEVGDFFAAGNVSPIGLASLSRQDFTAAAGSADIWQRFSNSLRLRIALHLATNGELTSVAHAAIKEILENPSKYPLIETNEQNQGVNGDTQTDNFNYGKGIAQALAGRGEGAGSQAMLDAMNVPANGIPDANTDPRIEAIYDCNPDGEYVAYNNALTETQISNIGDEKNQEYIARGVAPCNYYCYIDSIAFAGHATYYGNENLNGVWISAAEVAFSKAEAYLMGYGVAKNEATAKTHFMKGVVLSNEYFWNVKLNSSLTTTYIVPVTKKDEDGKDVVDDAGNVVYDSYGYFNDSFRATRPLKYDANLVSKDIDGAKAEMMAYIQESASAYAEKIWDASQRVVATQLWLNFCYMNELEAWNVTRRTGYPSVKFARDTQASDYPTPPHRLPYTSDELEFNRDNVQAAIAKNYSESTGYYTKLFWAKENYYSLY